MKRILAFAFVLSAFWACKKKTEEIKPAETQSSNTGTVVVAKPQVYRQRDIRLNNQYSTSPNKYYRISDSAYFSNYNLPYDFCFIYYGDQNPKKKYAIGCPVGLSSLFYPLGSSVKPTYAVRFYTFSTTTSVLYDTLKVSEAVAPLVLKYGTPETYYDSDNWLVSDEFGWAVGTLFGFKLPNGKYGIAKITKQPTGSGALGTPDDQKSGSIIFDIKMER